MTQEELQTMANKIGEVAPDQLSNFMSNPDNFDYNVLEGYSAFTDKYKNVANFIGDKNAIKAQIWNDLNGKFPSNARFQSLKNDYPWLNKEDLRNWFDKSNEYKKFYEEEANKEAEKNLRKREVKEELGFWDNLLASEYSKQRYIDDPNASIIGKQGKFNPLSSQGAEELMDVGLGIAGAAGDVIPGLGPAFLGPAARATRDVAHKVYESPYQKDWTQIGTDIGKDVGTNLGAALLFNARKGARLASNASDKDVKYALEAARETEHIKTGLPQVAEHMRIPAQAEIDFYRAAKLPYPSSDRVLRNTIKEMPDSELKSELMKEVFTEPGRPINRKEVQRIYQKYLTQTEPGMREAVRLADDYMRPMAKVGEEPVTQYLRNAADAKSFSELSKYQKAQYLANKAAMAINSGAVGQVGVQELATGHGRGVNPKIVETALKKAERDASIDRIISNYSLLWNKNKEPAEAKNNPIIKAAYDKWKEMQ